MSTESVTKIVVCQIVDEEFGISIDHVISIEKMTATTKVPQLPNYMKGIIHLRGTVIPIVDLREYLMGKERTVSDENRIVVTKSDDGFMGLIVDAATDVLDITSDQIQSVSMKNVKKSDMLKVAKIGERLVMLLEIDSLMNQPQIQESIKEVLEQAVS